MCTANNLIKALNDAKANQIDVKIVEMDNGEICCTCTAGASETFTVDTLEQLVRRISMLVEDWRII